MAAGKKTAAQAVKDAAAEWEKITDRIGRDKQIAALQGQLASWPTITDTPTIKSSATPEGIDCRNAERRGCGAVLSAAAGARRRRPGASEMLP